MNARININVADLRHEPSNKSERVSQGLFNEVVEILQTRQSMTRIQTPDGYAGWIGSQFLTGHDGFSGDGPHIINSAIAPAFANPDSEASPVTYLPYGACLYGKRIPGYLGISSERYGAVYISTSSLLDSASLVPPREVESDEIRIEAEKFLGAPYLWGGRSFFGLDCSGFTQAIMQRFGVKLPRDSKDQMKLGREVKREEIRRGDLVFFPGHVALAMSREHFIHSSRANGGVAYNSLDPSSPIYNGTLDRSLIRARRMLN